MRPNLIPTMPNCFYHNVASPLRFFPDANAYIPQNSYPQNTGNLTNPRDHVYNSGMTIPDHLYHTNGNNSNNNNSNTNGNNCGDTIETPPSNHLICTPSSFLAFSCNHNESYEGETMNSEEKKLNNKNKKPVNDDNNNNNNDNDDEKSSHMKHTNPWYDNHCYPMNKCLSSVVGYPKSNMLSNNNMHNNIEQQMHYLHLYDKRNTELDVRVNRSISFTSPETMRLDHLPIVQQHSLFNNGLNHNSNNHNSQYQHRLPAYSHYRLPRSYAYYPASNYSSLAAAAATQNPIRFGMPFNNNNNNNNNNSNNNNNHSNSMNYPYRYHQYPHQHQPQYHHHHSHSLQDNSTGKLSNSCGLDEISQQQQHQQQQQINHNNPLHFCHSSSSDMNNTTHNNISSSNNNNNNDNGNNNSSNNNNNSNSINLFDTYDQRAQTNV
ncbi:unnamed protein product [Trichobilharzia regenti]|nr:unnamed protein product [Trichobilharzia regenti]